MNKKEIALTAALLFGLTGAVGAVPYNGHDYLVIESESITWNDAQAAALPGYHLATITSAGENDFIKGLVDALSGEEYWLGGYKDDVWTWVNGEGPFVYDNWNPIEPSGDGNFMAMWADDNRFNFTSGTWNDEGNLTWIDGYVLESVIPEPATLALFGLGLAGLGFSRKKKKA